MVSFHCLDHIRKQKRKRETEWLEDVDYSSEQVGAPSTGSRPDRELERKEVRERFEAALDHLKPEHRM